MVVSWHLVCLGAFGPSASPLFLLQLPAVLFKLQQMQKVDIPLLKKLQRRFDAIDVTRNGVLFVGTDIPGPGQVAEMEEMAAATGEPLPDIWDRYQAGMFEARRKFGTEGAKKRRVVLSSPPLQDLAGASVAEKGTDLDQIMGEEGGGEEDKGGAAQYRQKHGTSLDRVVVGGNGDELADISGLTIGEETVSVKSPSPRAPPRRESSRPGSRGNTPRRRDMSPSSSMMSELRKSPERDPSRFSAGQSTASSFSSSEMNESAGSAEDGTECL